MSNSASVVPVKIDEPTEASKDPLRIMIEIAENKNLSDEDKMNLIAHSKDRFTNRRRLAFIALYALVGSLGMLFLAAFMDGLGGSNILQAISGNETLFTWIAGFLTSIVAAYYGVTAWRPAS